MTLEDRFASQIICYEIHKMIAGRYDHFLWPQFAWHKESDDYQSCPRL